VKRLEGKDIVLTGAAGGIGALLAERLKAAGARVTGVDRIACTGCDEAIVADLADEQGLAQLSDLLAGREVDILVNMAGIQYFGPFDRQEPADIRLGYTVNLIAPATLIRAVLPQMRARGSGQIVNIGSILGSINYPHFAAYSSAKAGLHALSEGLRRELGGLGIDVTYIAPRAVNTGFNNAAVTSFFQLARMKADAPDAVAVRIVRAIAQRRKEVFIGLREGLLTRVNAVSPRLIDAGLAGQTAKARRLFS